MNNILQLGQTCQPCFHPSPEAQGNYGNGSLSGRSGRVFSVFMRQVRSGFITPWWMRIKPSIRWCGKMLERAAWTNGISPWTLLLQGKLRIPKARFWWSETTDSLSSWIVNCFFFFFKLVYSLLPCMFDCSFVLTCGDKRSVSDVASLMLRVHCKTCWFWHCVCSFCNDPWYE